MFRNLAKVVSLFVLVVAGAGGLWFYQDRFSTNHQIAELELQKQELQQIVRRLGTERRVADVLVTDQTSSPTGVKTTLLFVEYAADGSTLPPKSFTFDGDQAHIDAMVVKFDQDFVAHEDPLRGHSIALFTKLYGDKESPAAGHLIDEPGKIPAAYQGADPKVTAFEMELWKNFWQLVEDPAFRQSKGVRIAQGEGVWLRFRADQIYTLTIEANGGLNIHAQPLKGIYREALKRKSQTGM